MHPTLKIQGVKSSALFGKKIILGITGSIAAVKSVELARELIRNGAEVHCVMSNEARKIIHPNAMEYATGRKVITKIDEKFKKQVMELKNATKNSVIIELDGKIQHVQFCGIGGEADLLLIAPATANTISKISQGIDDTPVTTFATTALGCKKPIIIVPAMHESMYMNRFVAENIKKLKKAGIKFIEPIHSENKAKFPSIEEIVMECERTIFGQNHKSNMKKGHGKDFIKTHNLGQMAVLIASGPSSEEIDPIRVLTNKSSGRTGIELAKHAYSIGANVTFITSNDFSFSGIDVVKVFSSDDFERAIFSKLKSKKFDVFLMPAAISDFEVKKAKTKIKSDSAVKLKLELVPRKKIIDSVVEKFPKLFVIAFKAESNVSEKELLGSAKKLLSKLKNGFVVANLAENAMGKNETMAFLVSKDGTEDFEGTKQELAAKIFEKILPN